MANPNPSKKFTSETAPRQGGKAGRHFRSVLFRTNAELLAKQKGISPLELFLGMINDDTLPLEDRKAAADSAARYVHKAMPQAVEHSGTVRMRHTFAEAVLSGEVDEDQSV